MTRSSFLASAPSGSRPARAFALVVFLALAPALLGCVSYEPAPVDVSRILADLRARTWEPSTDADHVDEQGASPDQLAAFAITHDPSLRALRAQIGVARALLVEAGRLSDPEIGWDGMDALASRIVEGTTSSVDFVSGFGLSVPLPRPGELDARKGAARWRVEELRRRITSAEWQLALEVHVACEDVLEAERLLDQNQDLVQVAETTRAYFEQARAAGAATAIQANLAAGDVLAIGARRVRLEAGLRAARHRLHALLGLPPSSAIPLVAAAESPEPEEPAPTPEALVERSLRLRPDLAALLASYGAAEDELRLEIARQFPLVAVGTGITLVPGVLTRFNEAAIDAASARREALRAEIEARVHEVRRAIHDAHAALQEARREVDFLETELLPNAEHSLRLAGQAFEAGEVTLLEILSLQRALHDARTQTTEARAEHRRRRWRLLAASGTLLGSDVRTSRMQRETETKER